MKNEKWKTKNEKRKMKNEKWKMKNEKKIDFKNTIPSGSMVLCTYL